MSQMPTGDPTGAVPIQRQIADLRKEIEALRRQVGGEAMRHPEKDVATFSHPGEPDIETASPPYVYHRPRGYLTRVVVAARNPSPEGPTVVRIRRRAPKEEGGYVTLAEVTLAKEDEYTVEDDFMSEVEDLDRVVVMVSEAGKDLTDLTVFVTFMESVE